MPLKLCLHVVFTETVEASGEKQKEAPGKQKDLHLQNTVAENALWIRCLWLCM